MSDMSGIGPRNAKIDIATAATHEIIAAPGAAKQIVIYTIFTKSTASNTVTWKDGLTALTGAIAEAANSGEVVNFNPEKPLVLTLNSAFNITLGSAQQVSGIVLYAIKG